MLTTTHYDTLGLSPTASPDDIKRAYRRLAMQYHPDRNQGKPTAEAKFKEVQKAYEILFDPESRQAYDVSIAVGAGEGFDSDTYGPAMDDEDEVPLPTASDRLDFQREQRRFWLRRRFADMKRIILVGLAGYCVILLAIQWFNQRRGSLPAPQDIRRVSP